MTFTGVLINREIEWVNYELEYASHTELLEDDEVDAVAVTLGHQLHHRVTVDLVEKPMAISLEQCDDIVAAAAPS